MSPHDALVSVVLPVYNGAEQLESVTKSVLAQDHEHLELLICDNASTDGTEDAARAVAAADERVRYHRHPRNVGLLNNFIGGMRLARGEYLRWIGDSDWIAPDYLTRCLDVFASDHRLILVTSQMAYTGEDGLARVGTRAHPELSGDDPVARFAAVLDMCVGGYLHDDPLYGLFRRSSVLGIDRRNTLREDEIFGARLALAGPWGHVPEPIAHRHRAETTRVSNARLLGVPVWQNAVSSVLQSQLLLASLRPAGLTPAQRRRARSEVAKLYLRRKRNDLERARRKAARLRGELFRTA